jgi:hypothetical protein
MPFVVEILHIDFIDSTGYKHAIMKQAEVSLVVVGATTGYSIDINYNAATIATITEGVEWTNAATAARNAQLISQAINQLGLTGQIAVLAEWAEGTAVVKVYAKMIGRGGTGYELDVAGGANITVDGVATATFRDYTYDGRGPAGEVLQQWLDANVPVIGAGAGERIDGSLQVIMVPIPEGTQVLIMWEEN